MKTLQEMIAVMQAGLDGKRIQYQDKKGVSPWQDCDHIANLSWDWWECDYRVKPEPREFWANVYPGPRVCFHSNQRDAEDQRTESGVTIKLREVIE